MKKFRYLFAPALVIAMMQVPALGFQDDSSATVKGKIVFDPNWTESWDGHSLIIPFEDIETSLFEQVELPPIPFPENWGEMKPEQRQEWAQEFDASEEGKKLVQQRKQLIEDANAFEVKLEKDGDFVVYDVPPGIYGLQGRVDKEIGGVPYGFEVFGELEVLNDVDEVVLDSLQVAVTPLLPTGIPAPPVAVKTHNDNRVLNLDDFKDQYLLLNFWITTSPSAEYQAQVQKAFASLKGKHPIQLLSICVDEDRPQALKYILEKELREGSHGFTDGLDHPTLFHYGIRTIPSFWLIGPDRKIAMNQYEIAMGLRTNQPLETVISNRIEGKDTPTPAASGSEESGKAN